MFCDSLNDPDEKHPNVNVCPICMGHPGTLPVINEEALKKLMTVGLALSCSIQNDTFFERKNYFYPDLPKGYQISQYQKPLCYDGKLEINDRDIRIERIHLEEDAGRLYHPPGKDYTLVDYNRAGLPLMELVTKPDLENVSDVLKFATELRLLLRYLGTSDADMEKGQMRVEVNISIRPEGTDTLGTKVEVKNINSISAAGKAVEYEIVRQTEALEAGEKIIQETRGWDDVHNKTVSQRTKEGSADYRYFPEPDLPPMRFEDTAIEEARASLPELPSQRRARFTQEYGLPERDIETLTTNKLLGDYFENVMSEASEELSGEDKKKLTKLAANYVITEYQRRLSELGADPFDTKLSPEMFGEFIALIVKGAVSSSAAQTLLNEMLQTGLHPDHIIHEKDLGQVSDTDELNKIIEQVVLQEPKAAEDFKKGKEASLKFLVGKIMAASKGKANPQVVQDLIKRKLQ